MITMMINIFLIVLGRKKTLFWNANSSNLKMTNMI